MRLLIRLPSLVVRIVVEATKTVLALVRGDLCRTSIVVEPDREFRGRQHRVPLRLPSFEAHVYRRGVRASLSHAEGQRTLTLLTGQRQGDTPLVEIKEPRQETVHAHVVRVAFCAVRNEVDPVALARHPRSINPFQPSARAAPDGATRAIEPRL